MGTCSRSSNTNSICIINVKNVFNSLYIGQSIPTLYFFKIWVICAICPTWIPMKKDNQHVKTHIFVIVRHYYEYTLSATQLEHHKSHKPLLFNVTQLYQLFLYYIEQYQLFLANILLINVVIVDLLKFFRVRTTCSTVTIVCIAQIVAKFDEFHPMWRYITWIHFLLVIFPVLMYLHIGHTVLP